MALSKNLIDEKTGLEVTYWKVCDTRIDNLNKIAEVTLKGWSNEESRLNGKPHISSYFFIWSKDDFNFNFEQNIISQIYNKIKEKIYYKDTNEKLIYCDFTNSIDV